MKRRDFLGTLAAGATLASLPINVFATPDPIIWNAETLAAKLEGMFSCRTGPAMGFCYFNSKTGSVIEAKEIMVPHPSFPHWPNMKIQGYEPAPEGYSSYAYESYVCAVEGGTAQDAESRLAKHFYDEFSKVPAGALVWRVKPYFESDEVIEYGKTYLTMEQVEDRSWVHLTDYLLERDGHPETKTVRMIDGVEFTLPKDVEFNPNTGGYSYVNRKYQLHKMRMRLVLPDTADAMPSPDLILSEGGKPVRI